MTTNLIQQGGCDVARSGAMSCERVVSVSRINWTTKYSQPISLPCPYLEIHVRKWPACSQDVHFAVCKHAGFVWVSFNVLLSVSKVLAIKYSMNSILLKTRQTFWAFICCEIRPLCFYSLFKIDFFPKSNEGGRKKQTFVEKKLFISSRKSNEGEKTNKKNLQWSNKLIKFHHQAFCRSVFSVVSVTKHHFVLMILLNSLQLTDDNWCQYGLQHHTFNCYCGLS